MRKKISYFSYDGILEPLGNSQVLNYLVVLSKNYDINLFTFEKAKDLKDFNRLSALKLYCVENSIEWNYSNFNEGSLSSIFNPLKYLFFIFKNILKISNVIHARSFIPSFVAFLIFKIKKNSKFIYDMRGYWIEEKIDVGKIKSDSIIYKILKRIDNKIILNASHIVTLSNISKNHIQEKYKKNHELITTIYTCTDLNKFKISRKSKSNICFGYVGTTVGWYQFDETVDFIKLAFDSFPNAKFKIITRDNKTEILDKFSKKNIDLTKVFITTSTFENIQNEYNDIDIAVFFIKQSFSKTASMPTKFGEFLASGIACIVNSEIGDMPEIIKNNPSCGFVTKDFSDAEYKKIINQLYLYFEKEHYLDCRNVAESFFSLEKGASAYSMIYEKL